MSQVFSFLTLVGDYHREKNPKIKSTFIPLIPGGNKKVTHTETNLQLKAADLFKYVTFLLPPGTKELLNFFCNHRCCITSQPRFDMVHLGDF